MHSIPLHYYIQPGMRGRKMLPHSEVCMHMRVASRYMDFILLDRQYPMVQLLQDDGQLFSSPITTGEAGLFYNNGAYYYYPHEMRDNGPDQRASEPPRRCE